MSRTKKPTPGRPELPGAIVTKHGIRPVLAPQLAMESLPQQDLISIIAKAIRTADTTYFFENYTKQSLAVMRALAENGYWVAPTTPTPKMLEAGRDALRFGVQKSGDSLSVIYKSMIEAHKV